MEPQKKRPRALVTKKDGFFWRQMSRHMENLEELGQWHNRECQCLTLSCIESSEFLTLCTSHAQG